MPTLQQRQEAADIDSAAKLAKQTGSNELAAAIMVVRALRGAAQAIVTQIQQSEFQIATAIRTKK